MRRYPRKTERERVLSVVIWGLLAVVLLPVTGLYLMSSEDVGARPWGSLLFVLGAAIWFAVL